MAMSRKLPIEVERVELRSRNLIPGRLARFLSLRLPPAVVLGLVYGASIGSRTRPDIVLSAGGKTLAANVAFRKAFRTLNIFSGTPRHVGSKHFSLVLTPYRSQAALPNTLCALKPSALDPDALPSPKPFPAAGFRVGVLVGGAIPSANFTMDDWRALCRLLKGLHDECACELTIVTSRRTPVDFYAAYDEIVRGDQETVHLVDYRKPGTGSINDGYAADAILVTSDSMSMITEGCAARRPVVVLEPDITQPFRDGEAVKTLAENGYLAVRRVRTASPAEVTSIFTLVVPMKSNHLDVLAEAVVSALDKCHET